MSGIDGASLDRYITGNYGEAQFAGHGWTEDQLAEMTIDELRAMLDDKASLSEDEYDLVWAVVRARNRQARGLPVWDD